MQVTFADVTGEEWPIDVTPPERDDVLAATQVDIYDMIDETKSAKLIGRLETDDALLVSVVYAICKPIADERNITEREFRKRVYGNSLNGAMLALLKSSAFFFRNPVHRTMIETLVAAMEAAAAKQTAAGELMRIEGQRIVSEEMAKTDVQSVVKNSIDSVGRLSQSLDTRNGKSRAAKRGSTQPTS